jgi:tetratricopeptide (TPR) repeat protein
MTDPVEVAAALLNGGRLEEAEGICRRLLASRPEDPRLLHVLARAANVRRAHDSALEFVARARRDDLAHLQVECAIAYRGLGAHAAALAAARQAVAPSPDVPNGYQTLAGLLHPGDDYRRVPERKGHAGARNAPSPPIFDIAVGPLDNVRSDRR